MSLSVYYLGNKFIYKFEYGILFITFKQRASLVWSGYSDSSTVEITTYLANIKEFNET